MRGKIVHEERARQLRDYTGMRYGTITPTDIDGLIEYHDTAYFIFEFKLCGVEMKSGQRLALERLCDDLSKSEKLVVLLICEHNTPVDLPIPCARTRVIEQRYQGISITGSFGTLKEITDIWLNCANALAYRMFHKGETTMEDTKSLTVQSQQLTPQTWHMIQSVAPAMHTARWFGVLNPEQAAVIMLKGYELGLGLAAAFEYIKPIQGKPSLVPRGALALIHGKEVLDELKVEDLTDDSGTPTACQVTMRRADTGFEYSATFSMDDARRAGLVKPDSGWTKYPANMLRWRAIGFCADVVCPDVLGGMKRADELGADLTPTGEVISGVWEVTNESESLAQPAGQAEAEAATLTLDDLLAQYSPEAILEANDGRIPMTLDEVAEVAEALAETTETAE